MHITWTHSALKEKTTENILNAYNNAYLPFKPIILVKYANAMLWKKYIAKSVDRRGHLS